MFESIRSGLFYRLCFLLIAESVTFCQSVSAGDEARSWRMEDVAGPLIQWRDSVSSLHLRCRWTFDKDTLDAQEPGAAPADVQIGMEFEWAWTDRGQVRYHREDHANGVVGSRQLWTIDGDRSYTLEFADGVSDPAEPVTVMIQPAPRGSSLIVEPLFGLWDANDSCWLGTLVETGKASLAAGDGNQPAGAPALKLQLGPKRVLSLTLDPDHGMLPRTVRQGSGQVVFENHVEEFREVAPGIWFPWSGALTTLIEGEAYSRKRWTMLEVKVNDALPRALFRPPIPKGTHVVDAFSGTTYYEGGVAPPRSTNAGATRTSLPGATVSGTPPGFSPRAVLLLLAAAVVFFAAAIYERRRRA